MHQVDYFSASKLREDGRTEYFYDNELYSPDCRFAVFVDTWYPDSLDFNEQASWIIANGNSSVPEVVIIKRVYGEPADFIPYCREGKVAVEHFADLEIASSYAKLLALEKCLKIELMLK